MEATIEANKALFIKIGLTETKALETAKNAALSANLLALIQASGTDSGCEKTIGAIFYTVAAKYPKSSKHIPLLVKNIVDKKIVSSNLPLALELLEKTREEDLSQEQFEKECGIGAVVTEDDIRAFIKQHLATLDKAPKKTDIIAVAKKELKGVDGKILNTIATAEINAYLKENPGVAAPVKVEEKTKVVKDEQTNFLPQSVELFDPKDNTQLNDEILKKHLEYTGGMVRTRFPPEPNGYLHVGHVKAMNLDFGYATKKGGVCFLRFDDTNPEAETPEYIDGIINNVDWMGFKPYKITYSSDYFSQLHAFAVELIKKNKAYICHETAEEMSEGRQMKLRGEGATQKTCRDSPSRNRPIEESLELFDKMRKGFFKEGTITLRLKQEMQSPNPCMRDLVAYRIKYCAHPHVGDAWCIYPTYDFTHPIVDSLENITHSLCTLEFQNRREVYNWLLDQLEIYRPRQIENSRLCISHILLSKRKLIKLVNSGIADGWDDPRLPTLTGFRRKGYRPTALCDFCERVGITPVDNIVEMGLLEYCVRQDLDNFCKRGMAVLHPLKVVIENYPADRVEELDAFNHPGNKDRGTHKIFFSKVIYIDRSDFRAQDSNDYFGLAPNKEVGLRYAYNITCTEVIRDDSGDVVELRAVVDLQKTRKPKGHIHFVGSPAPGKEPQRAEIRLYDHLFKSANPAELGDNWLDDINPHSLVVCKDAFIDNFVASHSVEDKLQFERLGFFNKDRDSTDAVHVWNRTVTLKDSYNAKAAPAKKN
eukprot:TRINITY_DN11369_c0_g1_i1.p1 TRINITY_DN11369_c0_g1~~TRINITY_DN11369_c0_g1_i1.p1  ORF type:complete len:773 (+),score=368.15 TRINITY_DN11369_c0_g1_i1:30-2321(+)